MDFRILLEIQQTQVDDRFQTDSPYCRRTIIVTCQNFTRSRGLYLSIQES